MKEGLFFLLRTVNDNEKYIYLENLKCIKSWMDSGQPST